MGPEIASVMRSNSTPTRTRARALCFAKVCRRAPVGVDVRSQMPMAAMSIAKRLGATLFTVLVWELVNVTFAHWWAIITASEEVMGLVQFFAREILRNAP